MQLPYNFIEIKKEWLRIHRITKKNREGNWNSQLIIISIFNKKGKGQGLESLNREVNPLDIFGGTECTYKVVYI